MFAKIGESAARYLGARGSLWLVASVLAIALVVMPGLVYLNAKPGDRTEFAWGFFAHTEGQRSIGEAATKPEKWRGYYRDPGSTSIHFLEFEEVDVETLTSEGKTRVLRGEISGLVDSRAGRVVKHWRINGFELGSYRVLSYVNRDEPEAGIGAIFLAQSDRDFVGHWVGRSTFNTETVQCPYVMSADRLDSADALDRWPELAAPCQELLPAEAAESHQALEDPRGDLEPGSARG